MPGDRENVADRPTQMIMGETQGDRSREVGQEAMEITDMTLFDAVRLT